MVATPTLEIKNRIIEETPLHIIDSDLGISMQELGQGRRRFEMDVGNLGHVEVHDISATVLDPAEWRLIELARESYRLVWGGNGVVERIIEDPFDGRPPFHLQYHTTHQIAKFTSPDGNVRYATNRKVSFAPISINLPPLYDDIQFWRVTNGQEESYPLADIIRQKLIHRNQSHDGIDPLHQVAAISRTGTYPYFVNERDIRENEKIAVAWALMQVAVTEGDTHLLICCQLCDEFQQKVLVIRGKDSNKVMLDFQKTADTLGLNPGWSLVLDNENSDVRDHILKFPGYWTNNNDLQRCLTDLINERKLRVDDLALSVSMLLQSSERVLLKPEAIAQLEHLLFDGNPSSDDLNAAIAIMTRPRNAKFLISLLNFSGEINTSLTGEELRTRVLQSVGDGPFSATLIPSKWQVSAKNLIRAAKLKYSV